MFLFRSDGLSSSFDQNERPVGLAGGLQPDLRAGDLVFFRTYARFPSHVGIYLGERLFIHASRKSRKVQIDSLDAPYFSKRYLGGRRLDGPPVDAG